MKRWEQRLVRAITGLWLPVGMSAPWDWWVQLFELLTVQADRAQACAMAEQLVAQAWEEGARECPKRIA